MFFPLNHLELRSESRGFNPKQFERVTSLHLSSSKLFGNAKTTLRKDSSLQQSLSAESRDTNWQTILVSYRPASRLTLFPSAAKRWNECTRTPRSSNPEISKSIFTNDVARRKNCSRWSDPLDNSVYRTCWKQRTHSKYKYEGPYPQSYSTMPPMRGKETARYSEN